MKYIKKFLMDLWMCLNWWYYLPKEVERLVNDINEQRVIQFKEI